MLHTFTELIRKCHLSAYNLRCFIFYILYVIIVCFKVVILIASTKRHNVLVRTDERNINNKVQLMFMTIYYVINTVYRVYCICYYKPM